MLLNRMCMHSLRLIRQNSGFRCYTSSKSLEIIDDATFAFDAVPIERIRNFSIIAHIDHGKSTLADRLLEITGAISKSPGQNQVLDHLQVEKERGITVKAQSASLLYKHVDDCTYLLNLIDTPGHVDFANEVTRSLAACDGVILLVDAYKGIQAQTVANYHLAKSRGLTVVPVLNKIDLKNADPDQVCIELSMLFDFDPESVLRISAKTGLGVESVLGSIVERIPAPNVDRNAAFRGLIFDSWYDSPRGALNLVYVRDGEIKVGNAVTCYQTKKSYNVRTLSILRPDELAVKKLVAGQVGLIACNMKDSKESLIGDTMHRSNENIEPLPGFRPNQAMIFAGIYPADQTQNVKLRTALEKLTLNDSAVTLTPDSSPALGQGWQVGFLGILHMEVFCQRLSQEYDMESIVTAPSVTYKLKLRSAKLIKTHGTDTIFLSNPTLFPEPAEIEEYFEPCVLGTIITPNEYIKEIKTLCVDRRGVQESSSAIDDNRTMLTFHMPLAEVVLDFHDKLKSITSGYASFDYEDRGYQSTDVVKMTILLNGKIVDELSRIVHCSSVNYIARDVVLRLRDLIPRQMVLIAIQACVGSKVLARENIKPYRKDVTAKLYGGDVTRRMKLVRAQNEGKKKMRSIANVNVPHDTFIKVLKR